MKNLYTFYADFGRMGHLEGRLRATKKEVSAVIGKYIHFGEVLGKHSDIGGAIEECDIILLTDNKEFLDIADELKIDLSSGYNPLIYYTCKDCGDICDIFTGMCQGCGSIREDANE